MGTDVDLARAAWVSTKGERAEDENDLERIEKLLSYLMRNKHGTPFEHGALKFRVTGPIVMWREHMRHRIGTSYNEESGRYKKLSPVFYMPDESRIQEGKPGHYVMKPGDSEQTNLMRASIKSSNRHAYAEYEMMLQAGIAREVARMVLPVNIMSTAYVTFNPRSLMHFLGLRLPATAQEEIRSVAAQYLAAFSEVFPITALLFVENEYIAP